MKTHYFSEFRYIIPKMLMLSLFLISISLSTVGQVTIVVNSTSDGNQTTVTNLASNGTITLRYAVNYHATRTIVKFDPSISGQTISLTQGDAEIRFPKSVEIDGETNNITIDGGGLNRLFYVTDAVENASTPAIDVVIKNLTFKNGKGFRGGAIRNFENLTIENCVFENNTVTNANSAIWGGAVSMEKTVTTNGKLTIKSSVFKNNSLANGQGGGAVATAFDGTGTARMSIENSVFIGNTSATVGGAIAVFYAGEATLVNNTFYNNHATTSGGGIYHNNGKTTMGANLLLANTVGASNTLNDMYGRATTGSVFTNLGYNVYQTIIALGEITQHTFVWNAQDKQIVAPENILSLNTFKGYYILTTNGNTETRIVPQSFISTNNLTTDVAGISRSGYSFYNSGAKEYRVFRSNASGNWNTTSTWESSGDNTNWISATSIPSSTAAAITIQNGHLVSVTVNATSPSLTINSGGQLTLSSGSTLGISGNFTVNSDGTNGTGTFVDENTSGGLTVSGITNVQQYLTSLGTGVSGRNWYISSPLSAATSSIIATATGNGLVYYNVGNTSWDDAGTTMEVMKGYIAKSPAQNTTISFTGGSLNTGSQSVNNLPVGFNLVGNPYPSYVNWTEATKSNITNSIWYRSKKSGSYNFHTYNVTGGVGVNDGTDIIPPMQSFWIKTANFTNLLGFTNAMRTHQDQSIETNRLKAPKVNTGKLLRLQVSNGTNKDEAVVYFNSEAQNSVDEFDSQKMFNNITDVPEIYTQIETEKLVINGMSEIQYDTEIPLGFSTLQANDFSIKASEFNNFDTNTIIVLKDNDQKTEQDLTSGSAYNFESGVANTSNRFSLIFRVKGTTTEVTNNSDKINTRVFVNIQNQITIVASEKCSYTVYNAMGQKQLDGILKSTNERINKLNISGVYFVELSINGRRKITKVAIR